MLELLSLAALRPILNRSVVTTTSPETPLMAINGHNRREWIVAVTPRARPLTWSDRFLRYVSTDRLRPGSDPVMSDVIPSLRVPFAESAAGRATLASLRSLYLSLLSQRKIKAGFLSQSLQSRMWMQTRTPNFGLRNWESEFVRHSMSHKRILSSDSGPYLHRCAIAHHS